MQKALLKEVYGLYQRGMKEGTLMYTPYVAVAKSLENGEMLIKRKAGRIIAFTRYGLGKRRPVCRLLQIYVVPESRRKGIGSQLLREVERIARATNMVCVQLKTGETNILAQRFYEAQGYAKTDRKEKKVVEIVFEKPLALLLGVVDAKIRREHIC